MIHALPRDRRLIIVTADDFGLDPRINAGVEIAHRDGILTGASLMVGAPAAADAVERARRLPQLKVGLHIVLADGAPVLAPARIPDLVGADGRFDSRMVRAGVRFFFLPRVRTQLAAEIRAQFEAFAATGLVLDHVNTHKHFHLHPTVLELILSIGREFGLAAMRLPEESGAPFWLRPWMSRVRRRLDRAGIAHNDFVVGLAASGRLDESTLLEALARLPSGVGELYLHPATADDAGRPITASMQSYRHADELAALVSPRVRAALTQKGLSTGTFSDLVAAA